MLQRIQQGCEYLTRACGWLCTALMISMVAIAGIVGLLLLGLQYQAYLPDALLDPLTQLAQELWFQDLPQLLFAWIFLLGIAYALLQGSHVRVDVFYSRFTPRTQAWIDLLGTLILLLPVCMVLFWQASARVVPSVLNLENSSNPGGMPFWLFNLPILGLPVTLFVQGLAESIKNLLQLRGKHA